MNRIKQAFLASQPNTTPSWSVILGLMLIGLVTLGCAAPATPTPAPTAAPTNAPVAVPTTAAAGPTNTAAAAAPTPDETHKLLRPDMKLRKVATVGSSNVKLGRNPLDGELYYLSPDAGVYHLNVTTGDTTRVIKQSDIVSYGVASGMTFAPNGELLVLFNQNVPPKLTQAVIYRGTPAAGKYTWDILARTEPYPLAGNNFDHFYNGLVVSPDGKYVFVNAGSRSDHGEVEDNSKSFPDLREVPLTSAMFRIPMDSKGLVLPADATALKPYLYADGTRNEFDPEFAPNGDLIAGDNGPDADYPDELNWIREGHHYGFPWKFGTQDNPQQFPTYTKIRDNRLQSGFFAVDNGFYHNDKTFPTPPAGVTFTDPIVNLGPDADTYRADDGSEHDSSNEKQTLNSFTPHRSPLGLVFATSDKLPADLRSTDTTISAFLTSWGAAAGTLSDRGADLLHLQLTKKGDNYEMVTTQVATGFNFPIDGVLIDNHYYMLEWGAGGAIWEITFGE